LKLKEYFRYYHEDRTHIGLDKDTPFGRPVQKKPENGTVITLGSVKK